MNILEKSKIHDIIEVKPLEGYKLFIKFDDGLSKSIDIKPYIGEGISKDLESSDYFNKVYIDNGTITWPNGYDFCPVYLRNEV
jgi:hypothetical protein